MSKKKQDQLGKRIKDLYENITRDYLPENTYSIIRLDGKAFHTFTKGLNKPFDDTLVKVMDSTALYLCDKIQGARFAYVQSDEISILMTDFYSPEQELEFKGNIQKIVSVGASRATSAFNKAFLSLKAESLLGSNYDIDDMFNLIQTYKCAEFDARTFTIDHQEELFEYLDADGDLIHIQLEQIQEVVNYFLWRQRDCIRNSIQMVAQSHFSQKELDGKSTSMQKEMLLEIGDNWTKYPLGLQRGRMIIRQKLEDSDKTQWVIIPAIDISNDREKFMELIPTLEIV